MINNKIDLFVPGRICILGEHSDWAGGHRRQNSDIEKGYALVAPTNQGTYAKTAKLNQIFFYEDKQVNSFIRVPFNKKDLKKVIDNNNYFSYVCGVAYQVLVSYKNIDGLYISNYKTNLPKKKGLSSSASACVLVAKAFNQLYNLNWTIEREMEMAYLGEITTSSRCGKLDQSCAYDKPVLIEFDADFIKTEEIQNKGKFYFVIVDLHGQKDTKTILTALNKGFPFPTTKKERQKHYCLGKLNKHLVLRGAQSLRKGDPESLGRTMTASQKAFDKYLAPHCPSELKAPRLHYLLNYDPIKPFIYGAKGVGSQGDGTAQILCKNKEAQDKIIDILSSNSKHMNFSCLRLII